MTQAQGFRFPADAIVIQCAANFSEGRRQELIARIAGEPIVGDAVVADVSSDRDHNRAVITWLGPPDWLRVALRSAALRATQLLDLREHKGVHPRLGVVDVVPFTPIRNATMQDCIGLARSLGRDLAEEIGIPVYYYEFAARPGRPAALPVIRRLAGHRASADPLPPDIEPETPVLSAGSAVVGARLPLVAFNVNLEDGDLGDARLIAASIRSARAECPYLQGVRALGFYLTERKLAQVSMNLTRPAETPLAAVYDFVAREAERIGAQAGEAEVVGLLPKASIAEADLERIRLTSLRPEQIVENWLSDK